MNAVRNLTWIALIAVLSSAHAGAQVNSSYVFSDTTLHVEVITEDSAAHSMHEYTFIVRNFSMEDVWMPAQGSYYYFAGALYLDLSSVKLLDSDPLLSAQTAVKYIPAGQLVAYTIRVPQPPPAEFNSHIYMRLNYVKSGTGDDKVNAKKVNKKGMMPTAYYYNHAVNIDFPLEAR